MTMASHSTRSLWLAPWACVGMVAWASCGSDITSDVCSGSRIFPVTAVDDETRKPLPSPIIAFEANGLASPSPSPSATYVFGGQGDGNGTLSPPLPCGRWGVHVFANGHRCQSLPSGNVGALEVGLLPLEPNTPLPLLTEATWSPSTPKAGSQVTLTVDTEAASAEALDKVVSVVAVESTTYRAIALAEVPAPAGSAPTLQRWQGRAGLTSAAGTFTYAIVAATETCLASKILRLQLSTSG